MRKRAARIWATGGMATARVATTIHENGARRGIVVATLAVAMPLAVVILKCLQYTPVLCVYARKDVTSYAPHRKGAEDVRRTPPLPKGWLLIVSLLALLVSACSQDIGPHASSPTPASSPINGYSLPGGGACLQLGQHPQGPFANVRVSHDSYLAHSEPMLVENPRNPLNLVGGTKFFTDPKHYQFQIGYFSSFDGGCTWTDGGLLPGFQQRFTLTSDISFAFGTHNDVYAAVLYEARPGMSGVAVSASTDGGKTFGDPVSVFE